MMEVISGANQLIMWIIEWAAMIGLYGLIFGLIGYTLWKILAALIKAAIGRLVAARRPVRTLKHRKQD